MATGQLRAVGRHILNAVADPTLLGQTDGALLRAFLDRNDQPSFEALVRRHGAMVLRVGLRALRNVHDAEDALQATFLVLAQQAASIRKRESLASWLHGVAYRMATRQRRMLIATRQELVGQRVACQNRIRALFAGQGLPTPSGAKAWTVTGLAGIEAQSKALAACAPDELWKGMLHLAVARYRSLAEQITQTEQRLDALSATDAATQLLETIPGMGPRTAEAVSAHLGDAKRFESAKQVGAFAGLVPRQYQSGVTDRKGRITRRGPGVLRKLLVSARGACCGTTRGRERSMPD